MSSGVALRRLEPERSFSGTRDEASGAAGTSKVLEFVLRVWARVDRVAS